MQIRAIGLGVEKEQQKKGNGSAYSYEDLTSNALGIYFEEWLENDETTIGELAEFREKTGFKKAELMSLQLFKFLKELGFVNDPENTEDYQKVANSENDATDLRGLKNGSALPKSETTSENRNSNGIDANVLSYLRSLGIIK
ncbi:hypothetical protein [Aquimarina macrocephali]|uniref:hypothetical protein n=1 Tax=Aquimarina macrocephali TaxID=666563 RepID=UPI003F665C0A